MDRKEIEEIFDETEKRIDAAFEKFGKEMIELFRKAWKEAKQKGGE